MDIVDRATRARMMSDIGVAHTAPEVVVRSVLHSNGFRFRVCAAKLPGRPDIVLAKWRAVILVHGCFWHKHDCHLFRLPKTREEFWRNKLESNERRDKRVIEELHELGWRTLVVWECALKGCTRLDHNELSKKLKRWIQSSSRVGSITGRPL